MSMRNASLSERGIALMHGGFDIIKKIYPPYNRSGDPPVLVYIKEDAGTIRMFFSTKEVRPNVEAIQTALNGLVYGGNCSGYDASRILHGDIEIHFNPLLHGTSDRQRAVKKVTEQLQRNPVVLEGDDSNITEISDYLGDEDSPS